MPPSRPTDLCNHSLRNGFFDRCLDRRFFFCNATGCGRSATASVRSHISITTVVALTLRRFAIAFTHVQLLYPLVFDVTSLLHDGACKSAFAYSQPISLSRAKDCMKTLRPIGAIDDAASTGRGRLTAQLDCVIPLCRPSLYRIKEAKRSLCARGAPMGQMRRAGGVRREDA